MKWILTLGFIIVAVAGVVIGGRLLFWQVYGEEYERFQEVQVGMSEAEVLNLLGQPYKTYFKDTAPEDYYVDGYSFKRRPITNKVLIYIATEPIAYVYLDENGRVEETFVGGS